MLHQITIEKQLNEVFSQRQSTVLAGVISEAYDELVRAKDFNELKEIVRTLAVAQQDLTKAQQRTEQRVEELVVAQQRTEQRVEELTVAQQDLTKAQQRTEQRVEELVVAQQRTEQRVEELAVAQQDLTKAQQRTEQRVEELAVAQQDLTKAQQRTEQRVGELVVAQQDLTKAQQRTERVLEQLSRQVGGISNRLGSDLEDVARAAIQDVLKRELGWNVGSLGPSWQQWNGKKEEVDMLGTATDPSRPHEKIWIVGEVKFNLTVKDVERFAKKVSRARRHLAGEMLAVCFCYRARPEVEEAATRNGIRMVYSYGRFV
jgi:multidrug efflux pump subunit AcrA (membrane-fusion protein)